MNCFVVIKLLKNLLDKANKGEFSVGREYHTQSFAHQEITRERRDENKPAKKKTYSVWINENSRRKENMEIAI